MKKYLLISILALVALMLQSCSENYSNGERVGYTSKISHKGVIWDSWEGHLNVTQTGMNTADSWDFSLDNDLDNTILIDRIKTAVDSGYKVKLVYHQVWGLKNLLSNRGNTDYFVIDCIFLNGVPPAKLLGTTEGTGGSSPQPNGGTKKVN